ncbi:MAG: DNA-binding response regulator [Algibacter sp.]
MNSYNVLIIEDHPLIIEAYKSALLQMSSKNPELSFNIGIAEDCDSAYLKIKNASKKEGIDLVFLDIKLPPSKNGKIISGEDLGVKIIQLLPNSKIIVATTFNDNYRINSIFKSINPYGFLIKNDLNPRELILAIESVIYERPYYSKSVIELMRKLASNDLFIDDIDRKILYELSKGVKMSQLSAVIPLSISALEKRKRVLKELFNIDKNDDKDLFRVAEEKGFI